MKNPTVKYYTLYISNDKTLWNDTIIDTENTIVITSGWAGGVDGKKDDVVYRTR